MSAEPRIASENPKKHQVYIWSPQIALPKPIGEVMCKQIWRKLTAIPALAHKIADAQ